MFTLWSLISLFLYLMIIFQIFSILKTDFFKKRGIKYLPYKTSIFGNMFECLTNKRHFIHVVDSAYYKFRNQKYFGFMQMNKPMIVVNDPELIKKITVKDFDCFQDRHGFVDEKSDPLFGCNLFALKGTKWREMRSNLSPAFTTYKIKNMFSLIIECAENLVDFYLEEAKSIENTNREFIDVEVKDLFSHYANDVIGTTAFGMKINSFGDDQNEFYKMGKTAASLQGIQFVKFLLFSSFPNILRAFGIKFFNKKLRNYFTNHILNSMKERIKNGIFRPDMIHLLIEAQKGNLKHENNQFDETDTGFATVEESHIGRKESKKREWTDVEVVAQALLFFMAGFDSVSTVLSFLFYEISLQPDIQKKLQKEIDELIIEKGHNNLEYTDLSKLKYLDMVVSEALRLWPPAISLDRMCNRNYYLPPPDKNSNRQYKINIGENVLIPIYSIHRDPKHFQNPNKFDPERFSPENRSKVKPFTYMPFGSGPRNCLGSRLSLVEMKAVVFYLLSKFDVLVTEKSQIPIKISKVNFNLSETEKGNWLGLRRRIK